VNLPSSVRVLEDPEKNKTYYIVGTAHISEQSVAEVNDVIEQVRPDVVCIELCEARYKALVDGDRWKNLDLFKVIREGKTLFLLANLAIGAYQRRLGAELGVKPGAEMLAGAEKAREVGAEIALADRDIHVTLKRTWANVGFWRKIKLLGAIVQAVFSSEKIEAKDIEKLKEKAQLSEMMAEFARVLPEVKEPLIDERDAFMMSKIEATEGEKVVAIVGAAHVEGMTGHFGKPVNCDVLNELPPPKGWTKYIKWLIPLLVLSAFSYGILKYEGESFEQLLKIWLLPNMVLGALFAALALAKPLSVLVSGLASPLTSLNPLLPSGVVVGLCEAWLRKPTVEDMSRINEDVQSFRGVYRNQFTRVLLVAVMSTLGSALGAWTAMIWLIGAIFF
jgi:pheromone shutdown-related protein TraB